MTQILAIIGSVLAIIAGLWKYFGRKNAEKRKKAQAAKEKFDEAQKNDDTSGVTSSFDRINRL